MSTLEPLISKVFSSVEAATADATLAVINHEQLADVERVAPLGRRTLRRMLPFERWLVDNGQPSQRSSDGVLLQRVLEALDVPLSATPEQIDCNRVARDLETHRPGWRIFVFDAATRPALLRGAHNARQRSEAE